MSFPGKIRRGPMAADVFEKQFVQINNGLFRDARLSLKAKGIFGFIATHRDGFGISEESIAASSTDGVSAVNSGLKELAKFGYLKRSRVRDERGRLGQAEYFITDMPDGLTLVLDAPLGEDEPDEETRSSEPTCENRTLEPGKKQPRSEPTCGFPALGEPRLGEPTQGNRPHKKTRVSSNTSVQEPPSLTSATQVQSEAPASHEGGEERKQPSPSTRHDAPSLPSQRGPQPVVGEHALAVAETVAGIARIHGETVGRGGHLALAELAQAHLDEGARLADLMCCVESGYDGAKSVFAVALSRLGNPLLGVTAGTGAPSASGAPGSTPMPEWCGECDHYDRTIELPDPDQFGSNSRIAPCPTCNPKARRPVAEPAF